MLVVKVLKFFVVVVQSGKKEHIVQHTIYNTGLHYVTMTTKHSEQ